jgi:hypothetical protein
LTASSAEAGDAGTEIAKKAGDGYRRPAGAFHDATVQGDKTLKMLEFT